MSKPKAKSETPPTPSVPVDPEVEGEPNAALSEAEPPVAMPPPNGREPGVVVDSAGEVVPPAPESRDLRLHAGGDLMHIEVHEDVEGELYHTLTEDEEGALLELLSEPESEEEADVTGCDDEGHPTVVLPKCGAWFRARIEDSDKSFLLMLDDSDRTAPVRVLLRQGAAGVNMNDAGTDLSGR